MKNGMSFTIQRTKLKADKNKRVVRTPRLNVKQTASKRRSVTSSKVDPFLRLNGIAVSGGAELSNQDIDRIIYG